MEDTIYLFEDALGFYKIGYTKNTAEKRAKSLHTGCSEDLILLAEFKTKHKRKVETALHNLYSHYRYKREFFDLPDDVVNNFNKTCQKIEDGLDAIKKANSKFY